jgi:hypothetical protein
MYHANIASRCGQQKTMTPRGPEQGPLGLWRQKRVEGQLLETHDLMMLSSVVQD